MKLLIQDTKYKNNVLFISGFMKDYKTWNITEKCKKILIADNISKNCNVVFLDLDESDYMKEFDEITNEIYDILNNNFDTKSKFLIVSHSYGNFFTTLLVRKWPKKFNKILLLDPTIKSESYYSYLKNRLKETDIKNKDYELINYKINNFDDFPECNPFKNNVIVVIYLSLEDKEYFYNKVKNLLKITNGNIKSRLIINNSGHMLHYKNPALIINSIYELIKL